jgi:general secretion pathway protein D
MPGLGRLFSSNDDTVNKTEVVLLITPHVVRNIERPGVKLERFNSGTESEVGGAPLSLVPASPPPPAAPGTGAQSAAPEPMTGRPPAAGPLPSKEPGASDSRPSGSQPQPLQPSR